MGGEAGIEASGAKVGVGLALAIDKRLDILEQVRQMLLGAFAAAEGKGIEAGHATFQFTEPLADRLAIPAQGAFSEALPARSEFLDGAGEAASAVGSFERLGGLDQPCLAGVS